MLTKIITFEGTEATDPHSAHSKQCFHDSGFPKALADPLTQPSPLLPCANFCYRRQQRQRVALIIKDLNSVKAISSVQQGLSGSKGEDEAGTTAIKSRRD